MSPVTMTVYRMLLNGIGVVEIARRLGRKPRTIKSYAARIYRTEHISGDTRLKQMKFIANHQAEIVQGTPTTVAFKPRQWRVVRLVVLGWINRDIGAALGTTDNVIKNYMRDILDIAGVDSRAELAAWYYAHRGIQP